MKSFCINKNEYSKSLNRLVKFYKFQGFYFPSLKSDKNFSLCQRFKKFLLILFSILIIFFNITERAIFKPEEVTRGLKDLKPVMKIVLMVGVWILLIEDLANYCFALIKGHKLILALNKPQITLMDTNTKRANRIIGGFMVKYFL